MIHVYLVCYNIVDWLKSTHRHIGDGEYYWRWRILTVVLLVELLYYSVVVCVSYNCCVLRTDCCVARAFPAYFMIHTRTINT